MRYKLLFVAGFIGNPKMNFFSCKITGGTSPALDLENGLIQIPLSEKIGKKVSGYPKKDELIMGIRPEAIILHNEKGKARIEAEVLFLEHFGSMNIINLQIGEKILKVRTRPTQTAKQKEKVWIEFEEGHMILFDEETEKALG